MKIYVDLDHVDITEYTQVESGEYNTNKINFIFTPEYKDLVKVAIFGCKLDTDEPKFYKIYLSDDSCYLPSEVTTTSDVISIGVYAFNVVGGELKLRYSPTPVKTIVYEGSFREEAENSSSPTPTEIEQIMSRIISLEELTSDLNTRVETLENKACDLDTLKSDVKQLKEHIIVIDDRLDVVEGDLADTYSKTEVDTLVGAKVDTTTFNLSQGVQDERIGDLELILSQWPTVTDTGTAVSLTPTIEYKMDLELKGNTSQNTLTGKNLYDKTTAQYYKWLTTVGTIQDSTDPNLLSDYIPTTQGETYTFSGIPAPYTLRVCCYSDKNTSTFVSVPINNVGNVKTFTAASNYILFAIGSGDTRLLNEIQMENGSTATTYEPYCGGIPSPNPSYPQNVNVVTGENTITISNGDSLSQTYPISLGTLELCKIGMAQDYIYYNEGKWYKHSQIGKVIFDGDVNKLVWSMSTSTITGLNAFWFLKALFPSLNIVESNLNDKNLKMTNNFTYNYQEWKNVTTPCLCENSSLRPDMIIFSGFSDITTVNEWNAWLSSHNTTMYYILKTETDTEITDTTLISQLDNIRNAVYSYNPTTNISQTNAGDPFIITATAFKKLS